MAIEESRTDSPSGTLLDRVAILTGSGRGIGRGIALRLARAGAHIVIAEQAADRITRVAAAVEDLGVKALGLAIDVRRGEDVQRMVQETVRHFGKIDILVNDAGRVLVKPMVEQSEADWDRIIDTNLKGVFLCCRYVVPEMIARKCGTIVNIASDRGLARDSTAPALCRVQGRSGRAHTRSRV